jgi:hypothetical protein
MSSKKCSRCDKTVYPIEELKCLDKVSIIYLFLIFKSNFSILTTLSLSLLIILFFKFYLNLNQFYCYYWLVLNINIKKWSLDFDNELKGYMNWSDIWIERIYELKRYIN